MRLKLERWASPIDELLIVTDDEGVLRGLDFANHEGRMSRLLRLHSGEHTLGEGAADPAIIRALGAYFEGDMEALGPLRMATGGTPFQRDVWGALRRIACGTTTTYGELAATLGRPGASRAVGAANGANPIAIVVPCHRVVGADGTLTGFAGGLSRKRWLLEHERRHARVVGAGGGNGGGDGGGGTASLFEGVGVAHAS